MVENVVIVDGTTVVSVSELIVDFVIDGDDSSVVILLAVAPEMLVAVCEVPVLVVSVENSFDSEVSSVAVENVVPVPAKPKKYIYELKKNETKMKNKSKIHNMVKQDYWGLGYTLALRYDF